MSRGIGQKKGWLVLLLMPVLALPPSASGQTLDQAVKLYRGGQLDRAQQVLLGLSTEQGQDPVVLLLLAKTEERGERSREYLQEAMGRGFNWDGCDQAKLLMCRYEFCRGMYLTTVDLAGDLEKEFPRSETAPEALWVSGCSHLAMDKKVAARIEFNCILTGFPGSDWAAWARLGIGDCFLDEEDYGQAVSAYHQVLDYHRDSEAFPFALVGLIGCYTQMDDPEKALLYHNLLMEKFPRSVESMEVVPRVSEQPKESEDEGRAERLAGVKYTIQLGVFGVRDNALRLQSQFQKQGYSISIKTKEISGKKYWVVQLGSFTSYGEASDLKKELEAQTDGSYRVVIR